MDAIPAHWAAPPAIHAPAPARGDGAAYKALIGDVRATLRDSLRPRSGYRVAVLDVTAPDFDAEVASVDRALAAQADRLRELGAGTGAYSVAFPVPRGVACLVAGYPPGTDVGSLLDRVAGIPVARAGLTDEAFARITLWHEAGHCLLGRSEAEADAFAFLAVLRSGSVTDEALRTWAAWRELSELTSPVPHEDHISSRVLRAILSRAGALRSDPRFAAMGAEGLAALARAFTARNEPDAAGTAHLRRVRAAVSAGVALIGALYPARGEPNLGFLAPWLATASGQPEMARVAALRAALATGVRVPDPDRYDPVAFDGFVAARKAAGDPVGEAMSDVLERIGDAVPPRPFDGGYGAAMAARIPYRPTPGKLEAELADGVAGTAVAHAGRPVAHAFALPPDR